MSELALVLSIHSLAIHFIVAIYIYRKIEQVLDYVDKRDKEASHGDES